MIVVINFEGILGNEYHFHQINEAFCIEKGLQICYNLGIESKKNNKGEVPMHSLNDTALESNRQIKLNFDGGDLSLQFTP